MAYMLCLSASDKHISESTRYHLVAKMKNSTFTDMKAVTFSRVRYFCVCCFAFAALQGDFLNMAKITG